MVSIRSLSLAAALSFAACSASAVTIDFDSGTPTFDGLNNLVKYEQDGYVFGFQQSGPKSSGANLFNTLFCVEENNTGGEAKCSNNDDGDLVPRTQGENGVAGNILIRQESPNNGNGQGRFDDDSSMGGSITLTLLKGVAFRVAGFSGVDEQALWIDVGSETCGAIDLEGNRDTGKIDCTGSLTSLIRKGDSFTVRYEGSGGVDSIALTPVPLPAGMVLMLTGLGGLALARRRRKA